MKLPKNFVQNMQQLLGEKEFQEFLQSFDQDRLYGLRVNTLKIDVNKFKQIYTDEITPIPWAEDGFYYNSNENPGKNPLHSLGIYYIQEPSAMLPAAILNAKPGERVLDLCAAPGGKSIQIAAGMQNKGLLVSNDISASRVKPLVRNLEFYGLQNCVVTNETPKNLSQKFKGFFDKILVDAPCSGEGMFRKDKEAIKSYEKYSSEVCCSMQDEILHYADIMLKDEGIIVYSTCTFNPDENERMIYNFSNRAGYEMMEISKKNGVGSGRQEWCFNEPEIQKTARIWPHKTFGEGHFAALLKKRGDFGLVSQNPKSQNISIQHMNSQIMNTYRNFERENLNLFLEGEFFEIKNNLYYLPMCVPDFSGFKIAKFGLFLGQLENDKFVPSHSFLISIKKEDVKKTISVAVDSILLDKYLRCESLVFKEDELINDKYVNRNSNTDLVALCVYDFPVGWGKLRDGVLKNLYPKGWRKQ